MEKTQAIILASGGLDSSVLAYYVKKRLKKKIKLLFFDYGQKCLREEIFCVKKLASELGIPYKTINLQDLKKISTSLINSYKKRHKNEIIKWYVPFRNSIFLAIALAFAESEFIKGKGKSDIFIGVKYEGEIRFKDTSEEFIKEMNDIARFSEKGKFKIKAPFINKDKEEIIELGKKLGVDFESNYSCYVGGGFAKINKKKIPIHCGKCAGCKARKKGFKFSNVRDVSLYKNF